MNPLYSLCICCLSWFRTRNKYVSACLLIIFTGTIIQSFAQTNQQPAPQNPQRRRARPAQPGQERPFVEPAEMHKAPLRVLETQPPQRDRWDTLPELMPISCIPNGSGVLPGTTFR